jgi:hypothetical protein
MSRSPPLRFLALLLAGWTGLRAAWLAPGGWALPAEAGGTARTKGPRPAAVASSRAARPVARPLQPGVLEIAPVRTPSRGARAPRPLPRRLAPPPPARPPWRTLAFQLRPQGPPARRSAIAAGRAAAPPTAATSRWSFSAWSFLRRGGGAALAPGGTLGGSQAGAVARFRLNRDPARPLAAALRLSSPVRRPAGAEAALGIDWRPSRRLPLHLLAERRQALGREGRSAFALTLHGGVSDAPLAGLRVEAYAQAGIVGTRSRDLFGDGALRLSVPLGRLRLGAGAWASAQPGIARLDLGPQALLRLPLAGRNVAVAADWRFRAAGNARPGSGPALTLSTDF